MRTQLGTRSETASRPSGPCSCRALPEVGTYFRIVRSVRLKADRRSTCVQGAKMSSRQTRIWIAVVVSAVGALTASSLRSAGSEPYSGKEWAAPGGDWASTRYSTLSQINTRNIKQLGGAWVVETPDRAEAHADGQGRPHVRRHGRRRHLGARSGDRRRRSGPSSRTRRSAASAASASATDCCSPASATRT